MSEQPLERNESEIARLMAEIDLQYQAAQYALSGQAVGIAQHQFITARLERIESARQELVELTGDEDQANQLVITQMEKSAQPKGEN
jgi:hypothetical protein